MGKRKAGGRRLCGVGGLTAPVHGVGQAKLADLGASPKRRDAGCWQHEAHEKAAAVLKQYQAMQRDASAA